jgi:alkylation response protein AidB-like acyl-CoA dehydrogenase
MTNAPVSAGPEESLHEALVASARRLAPRIRELAPAIDQEAKLPRDLVDAFLDAGFFHMLLPRDFGGLEASPVTQARVVEEVARADGSAGWCLMIATQSCSFAGLLAPDEAGKIWGPRDIVAGTARPIGRALRVVSPAPGYRVSGRWPFASGSSHATWFMGEAMVYDDGDKPVLDARGEHVSRALFFERKDVSIHDTWDTLGLRGTASNDFSVDGVFVPARRGFQMIVDPPQHTWALYRALPLVFINHGAHSLGIARAAIDTAVEIAAAKAGWGGVNIKSTPSFQRTLGEASVIVDAAARHFYATASELWESALAGEDDSRLRAQTRLATSLAAKASLQAVDMLHSFLATSAIFRRTPLERQFRDIHTANAHVMIGPLTFEAGGRVLMGMEPEFPFF